MKRVIPQREKLKTLGSEFQEGTGAISARAKFKNPLHTLKHGATGKVRLHEVQANAILIPQKSVLEIQDKKLFSLVTMLVLYQEQVFILDFPIPTSAEWGWRGLHLVQSYFSSCSML